MAWTTRRPGSPTARESEHRVDISEVRSLSPWSIVRAALPRMLISALGPIVTFYVFLRLQGVILAISCATAVGIGLFLYEHRRGRPGMIARVSLALTLLQAGSGYVLQSVFAYFAPARVSDLLISVLCAISVLVGRPLAAPFADELLLLEPEVRRTTGFRRTCRTITTVWAGFFLGRGAIGLVILANGRVELYVVVIALLDAPALAALLGWTLWYAIRSIHGGRSDDWIPAEAHDGQGDQV